MTNLRKQIIEQNQVLVDASGRLRTSGLFTLGEYKGDQDNSYLMTTEVQNGTAAYDGTDDGYRVTLNGTASGDFAIFQTRAFHNYFNGKSQLPEITVSGWIAEANIEKEFGYFSDSTVSPFSGSLDGFTVKNANGTLTFNVSKSGSTVASIDFTSWVNENGDGIDTTGGFIVFAMDFLHLGGTAVRLLTKIGGEWFVVATYEHSNKGTAGTFIDHPSQPIRWQIRSTGIYSGSPSFIVHCAGVSSEGSENRITETRPIHMAENYVEANTAGVWYALKGLRVNPADRWTVSVIAQISVQASTNDDFLWGVFINPTVAGTPSGWTDITNSHIQENTGDISGNPSTTTVTGGVLVEGKYASGNESISVQLEDIVDKIGSAIDGTMDEAWLCVMPMSINLDIRGLIVAKTYA